MLVHSILYQIIIWYHSNIKETSLTDSEDADIIIFSYCKIVIELTSSNSFIFWLKKWCCYLIRHCASKLLEASFKESLKVNSFTAKQLCHGLGSSTSCAGKYFSFILMSTKSCHCNNIEKTCVPANIPCCAASFFVEWMGKQLFKKITH